MSSADPSAHKKRLAIGLALFLLWPIFTAVRNGLSDIYARPAIKYLEQKRFATDTVSPQQWDAVETSVLQAHALMRGNPHYLEALGRLHQIVLSEHADELGIQGMANHAQAAQDYFAAAMANRPTWPYYWGNMALEHYRRGQVSTNEYSLALANATRFGPWKNDTQRLVMDLGSETWALLDEDARRQYVLNAERSLHRQPQNAVRIVGAHNSWPDVCTTSTSTTDASLPHLRELCARQPATRTVEQF